MCRMPGRSESRSVKEETNQLCNKLSFLHFSCLLQFQVDSVFLKKQHLMRCFWSFKLNIVWFSSAFTVSSHFHFLSSKSIIGAKLNTPNTMVAYIFFLTMSINIKSPTWNVSDSLCIYLMNPSGEKPRKYFWKGRQDFLFLWLSSGPFISQMLTATQRLPISFTASVAMYKTQNVSWCPIWGFQKPPGIEAKTSCPLRKVLFFLFCSLSLFK